MRLRADNGRIVRIAHRGVTASAPENSLAAIAEALSVGLDVVEVDVTEVDGSLVLAHSRDVARPDAPTLDEALAFFVENARPEAGIQLDLKPRRGAEARVVDAVRARGLLDRTFVSSTFGQVLRRVRSLEPGLTTALGYPYDRGNLRERGLLPDTVIAAGLRALRPLVPVRLPGMLSRAAADAASLHYLVVSRDAVRRCHERGLAVITWTVNESADLERVLAAGVDGVVTDDPGLVRHLGGPSPRPLP